VEFIDISANNNEQGLKKSKAGRVGREDSIEERFFAALF
jgi:hypothetical protein